MGCDGRAPQQLSDLGGWGSVHTEVAFFQVTPSTPKCVAGWGVCTKWTWRHWLLSFIVVCFEIDFVWWTDKLGLSS